MEPIITACEQADLLSILNDHLRRLNTKKNHQQQQKASTYISQKFHHKSCLEKVDYNDDDGHRKRLKQQLDPIRKALSEFNAEQYMSLKRCSKEECSNSMHNIARFDDR